MSDKDLNLMTLAGLFENETKAREFLEAKRWPTGPICPFCQSHGAYPLTPKPESTKPVRAGVYKCKACRKQFTVRVGTIFEDSHLSLSKWLAAIHLMTSSKKGISSHQLARELGITLKSAWFLSHRVREAMQQEPMAGMLSGTVEVDETYVGGKPRPQNHQIEGEVPKTKRGRGTAKQPVMVLVDVSGIYRSDKRSHAETFKLLVEQWHRETGLYSSISKKVQHPAYQKIIDMGHAAVPLILRELQQRQAHWFAALKAITHASPIAHGEAVDMKRATAAWVNWGKEHGYLES